MHKVRTCNLVTYFFVHLNSHTNDRSFSADAAMFAVWKPYMLEVYVA